ncbi:MULTISPECIES: hypothetical protein [unclassified Gilliamella]|uniref:hypothetical protein n=1 Tax=unclassified Gilliamella TaxID=2685620 RepID=UPI00080E3F53|nr:hypothetical protein [Gilliamella apicola]OCG20370.1 hypothetical protein A9G23_05940 [Gilliamella apicola]OCG22744.1 hypothetical protein A9G22_06990 [Gilliamella apicola]
MKKMVLGWVFICYILAICFVASIWFSDDASLMTTPKKVEYSFTILLVGIFVSCFVIVLKFIINCITYDIFKSEEKNYFVKKQK